MRPQRFHVPVSELLEDLVAPRSVLYQAQTVGSKRRVEQPLPESWSDARRFDSGSATSGAEGHVSPRCSAADVVGERAGHPTANRMRRDSASPRTSTTISPWPTATTETASVCSRCAVLRPPDGPWEASERRLSACWF